MLNKKGQENGLFNIGIFVLLAVAVIALVNQSGGLASVFSSEQAQQQSPVQQALADSCDDTSITAKVGPQSARWNPGTSVTSQNVYVWKIPYDQETKTYKQSTYDINVAEGSQTDGATLSVAFKDKMAFLYGYLSTSYWENLVEDVEVGCGTFSSSTKDSGGAALIANASTGFTFNFFNGDNNLKNDGLGGATANTANETLGSGDSATFTLGFEGTDKEGFSPPYPGQSQGGKFLVIIETNGTTYNEQNFQLGGKTTNRAAPSPFVTLNTDSVTKAWEVTGCPTEGSRRCNVNLGQLYVETASGSENPIGSGTKNAAAVGLGDIRICLYPGDWYLDTITHEPKWDYVKDDGTHAASNLYGANGICEFLSVA